MKPTLVVFTVALSVLAAFPEPAAAASCLKACKMECDLTDNLIVREICSGKCRRMVGVMEEFGLKKDIFLCRAVPSNYVAGKKTFHTPRNNVLNNNPIVERNRRLFKAHGRWCGPNWTDGKKLGSEEYWRRGGDFRGRCIDKADCACRRHDRQCAMSGRCCKRHDRELIHNLKATNSPWISSAMRVASWTRSC